MIDKVVEQNIVKDLKKQVSVKDIVAKYGVSKQTVYGLIEKHKIIFHKRKQKQYSESFIDKVLEDLKYDTSTNIAKKNGVSIGTIKTWTRKYADKIKENKVVPKKIENIKKRDDILKEINNNFLSITFFEWDELRVKGFEDLDVLTLKIERKKDKYRYFEFLSLVSYLKKKYDVAIIIKEFK